MCLPFSAQSTTSFTNVSVATTIKKPNKSKRAYEPRFELSAAQRADLKEAFDMLDADATGCIAAGDLKVGLPDVLHVHGST